MYFYALFALLLFLSRRMFLIVGGAIFAAGLTIYAADIEIPPWATVATNPLLLEFYLGTIIAFLFIRGYYLPPALALMGSRQRAQSRLVCVRFGAAIAGTQESQVKDEGVEKRQRLDGKTEIYPSNLVPVAIGGQDGSRRTARRDIARRQATRRQKTDARAHERESGSTGPNT